MHYFTFCANILIIYICIRALMVAVSFKMGWNDLEKLFSVNALTFVRFLNYVFTVYETVGFITPNISR